MAVWLVGRFGTLALWHPQHIHLTGTQGESTLRWTALPLQDRNTYRCTALVVNCSQMYFVTGGATGYEIDGGAVVRKGEAADSEITTRLPHGHQVRVVSIAEYNG